MWKWLRGLIECFWTISQPTNFEQAVKLREAAKRKRGEFDYRQTEESEETKEFRKNRLPGIVLEHVVLCTRRLTEFICEAANEAEWEQDFYYRVATAELFKPYDGYEELVLDSVVEELVRRGWPAARQIDTEWATARRRNVKRRAYHDYWVMVAMKDVKKQIDERQAGPT